MLAPEWVRSRERANQAELSPPATSMRWVMRAIVPGTGSKA